MQIQQEFILVLLKQLPPSAAVLNVLDVGGVTRDGLAEHRHDLSVVSASNYIPHWTYSESTFDAVIAFDQLLSGEFLSCSLASLRPGGRLIVINPFAIVEEHLVMILEAAGFVRILVEPAISPDKGVLIRGEKPHEIDDTVHRVEQIARNDDNELDLTNFRGPYVHLLIHQVPNKPVWRLESGEEIHWGAMAVLDDHEHSLLAFSSLPKAVNFMQQSILQNFSTGVNKVGKFRRQIALEWDHRVLLNPVLSSVADCPVVWIDIDPSIAERPDE